MPLCEIELELQRGKLADLFDVARELTRTLRPALPDTNSSMEALRQHRQIGVRVHVRFFNNNQIECRLQLMFVN